MIHTCKVEYTTLTSQLALCSEKRKQAGKEAKGKQKGRREAQTRTGRGKGEDDEVEKLLGLKCERVTCSVPRVDSQR